MSMDAILLGKVTHWLQPLVGAELQSIYTGNEHVVYFFFKTTHSRLGLKIDTTPLESHLSLVDNRPEVSIDTPYFLSLFRKQLINGVLLSIEQLQEDRIVQLRFNVPDEIGRWSVRIVIIELMGRATNIIVMKEDHQIIDALHRVPPSELTHRTIHPGAFYRFPPEFKKPSLYKAQYEPSIPIENQVSGASEILLREIAFRIANGQSFTNIRQEILLSDQLFLTTSKNIEYLHVLPLLHLNGTSRPVDWATAVNAFYKKDIQLDETNRLRIQVRAQLHKLIKKNNQKIANFSSDLQLADDRDTFKQYGQELLAYIDSVPEHAVEFIVPYSEPTLVIPLRAGWTAAQNADFYFKKYKKLSKSISILNEQIGLSQQLLNHYSYLLTVVDDNDAIGLKQMLQELGVLQAPPQKGKQKQKLKVLEFTTPSGTILYVGRNTIQNDYITFQLAQPTDMFVHAHQVPGSHVCIHHPSPSNQDLTIAAELAAYFSSSRSSPKVEVAWCKVSMVKKIPGILGLVRLSKFQSALFTPYSHETLRKGGTHE